MPFHSTTIFILAHLLPRSLAHLPQQKTPFELAILYNKSIADAQPSFLLGEAILLWLTLKGVALYVYVIKHCHHCVNWCSSNWARTTADRIRLLDKITQTFPCLFGLQWCQKTSCAPTALFVIATFEGWWIYWANQLNDQLDDNHLRPVTLT